MKIQWTFPLPLFINGPSPDALVLAGEFKHNDVFVKYELLGDKPTHFQIPERKDAYYCTARMIYFQIDDTKIASIQKSEYPQLLKLMVSVMNRILRGIRNAGIVPAANEINPLGSEVEKLFMRWAVKVSEDGKVWTRLVKEDLLQGLISTLFPDNISELDSSLWTNIEESIQDDIMPPPEQEFFVNCIEYLHNRNYRMAVVESVTCLDIVTNQYLKSYLASFKKIPKNRTKLFLQPQLGLTARIAVLLNLCLHQEDIKKIEFSNVISAIEWRNNIIHKSGHLPENLSDKIIHICIKSVLSLTSLLARSRNQVESLPEMQEIGKKISDKTSAPLPNIWVRENHKIIMEFSFFIVLKEFPGLEKLELIVSEAKKLLSERDGRFRPEEHLYIRFFQFPGELRATWSKGKLASVPIASREIGN